jgi:RimJ/RimL family protein N-acetyltransferase/ketosteroid isomerase-like protein
VRDEAEHKGDSEAVGLGARRCRDAEGVNVRRAEPGDVDFLAELLTHEDVEPFLAAVRPKDRESILAEIKRSQREPADFGVFVIEVDGARAGTMVFEVVNRRNRIAHLSGLAVHPEFRGRRLADEATRVFQRHLLLELGFHRLQLEVYGFNERAIAHAERVGFVREGVKRKAYRRHGSWVDGVIFGLLREDLGLAPGIDLLYEYVARHNAGIRGGEWGALAECFADDAVLTFEGVPAGPFAGREAIAGAYREHPPDDELRILDVEEEGGVVTARYSWSAAPEAQAGRLRLTRRGDEIERMVVTR